jgi:hypothetical protein
MATQPRKSNFYTKLLEKIQSKATMNNECYAGSERLTAVVMKTATFCDIAPCSPYVSSRFGHAAPATVHVTFYPTKNAKKKYTYILIYKECSLLGCYTMWLL